MNTVRTMVNTFLYFFNFMFSSPNNKIDYLHENSEKNKYLHYTDCIHWGLIL